MGLRDQKEMMEGARCPGRLREPPPTSDWTIGGRDGGPLGVDRELLSDNGDLAEDEELLQLARC